MNRFLAGGLLAALFLCAGVSFADTFGSGANSFDIEFVKVGNPGNPPDLQYARLVSYGAVPYEYRIGKYEISEQMIDKANALGGLGITKDTRGPDYPATSVTWYEAARFVNWLNMSTGNMPAYKFDGNGNLQYWARNDPGYDPNNSLRNRLAAYFLPSINEWYKAAYYDPAMSAYDKYPTGSNSVPDGIDFAGDSVFDAVFNDGGNQGGPNVVTNVGVPSPYGTFGQGGNVREWLETGPNTTNRWVLGGGWDDAPSRMTGQTINLDPAVPSVRQSNTGFRIMATVPEPTTATLIVAAVFGLFAIGKKRGRTIQNRPAT